MFIRVTLVTLLFLLRHHVIKTQQTSMESRDARFSLTHDYMLNGHVNDTIQSVDDIKCAQVCMQTSRCLSANYFIDGEICELNEKSRKNATSAEFVEREGWIYIEKMTMLCQPKIPCLNNGVCTAKYTSTVDSYNCTCLKGFVGQHCEKAISGYRKENPAISCKEIYDQLPSSPSGIYYLQNISNFASTPYQAYCVMDTIKGCGGGGWSLVMKIDGHKLTFHYDSNYWKDKRSYNPEAGKTGLDAMETKLPFYWSTPVTQLCLGMRVNNSSPRWLRVQLGSTVKSLYAAISNGTFKSFPSNVSQWRALVDPGSSLQTTYNRTGFNSKASIAEYELRNSRTRIGVSANNEPDAGTPDSRIGFGAGGSGYGEDNTNTCGNTASNSLGGSDNGEVSIKAFCYILIQ